MFLHWRITPFFVIAFSYPLTSIASIDRKAAVSRFNPVRNASSSVTPMQVGNGNFAFGADVTGLQTFLPFAILSSWAWKNDSFPPGKTIEDILSYRGVQLYNHGREVQYEFLNATGASEDQQDLQQWLISNPNRVNLGRTGLVFLKSPQGMVNDTVTEADMQDVVQSLDLWTGGLTSKFTFEGSNITVKTVCAQDSDVIGIRIESSLVSQRRLGLFIDFPWNDGSQKFSAPFVGVFNATTNHTTLLQILENNSARISHTMVNNTFITDIGGATSFNISRDDPTRHRYTLIPSSANSSIFDISLGFADSNSSSRFVSPNKPPASPPNFQSVMQSSEIFWNAFWSNGGFVDVVTGSTDARAIELQRRIILAQYLLRVNEAGDYPPQESGLVNNGWYGKFHMEMFYWHCVHWALWGRWDLMHRSIGVYADWFLATSISRSREQQGWPAGARWSKMTDPTGRSAPGEINELLIWEEVHPIVFAEYEYRAFPTQATLEKWEKVVEETANWMCVFAFRNISTSSFDLGPPLYVVSEDTDPLATQNPSFELAYWQFGLQLAEQWFERLGKPQMALNVIPGTTNVTWAAVREELSRLPITNGTYDVYEGIPADFWTDPMFTNDHPALVGLIGWLPPQPGVVDNAIAKATMEKVWASWNISNCWGWDFGMLALAAARNNEAEKAIEWLLHPVFEFDDVGMPSGGARVPTPYFPGAGSLLLAVAGMAAGWDGSEGAAPGFPTSGWNVSVEGVSKIL